MREIGRRMIAVAAVLGVFIIPLGCSTQQVMQRSEAVAPQQVSQSDTMGAAPQLNYPGASAEATAFFIDYESLADQADQVSDMSIAGERFGTQIDAPSILGDGQLEGIWVSKPDNDLDWVLLIYTNGVRVHIWVWRTASDAREWTADGTLSRGAGPHVTTVEVDGSPGYATPRLNVPPVVGKDGIVERGTGVSTGANVVRWSKRRFAVDMMHASLPVDELVRLAQQVKVAPTDN